MLCAIVVPADGAYIAFIVLITALCRISYLVAVMMISHIGGDVRLIMVENDRGRTTIARRVVVPIPWRNIRTVIGQHKAIVDIRSGGKNRLNDVFRSIDEGVADDLHAGLGNLHIGNLSYESSHVLIDVGT